MYCYQENKLPKAFNNFFATPSKEKMLTWRNTQITSICSSTNVGKQSINFYGPKVWNQIAPDFRKCKNITTFTQKILSEISQNKIKL